MGGSKWYLKIQHIKHEYLIFLYIFEDTEDYYEPFVKGPPKIIMQFLYNADTHNVCTTFPLYTHSCN